MPAKKELSYSISAGTPVCVAPQAEGGSYTYKWQFCANQTASWILLQASKSNVFSPCEHTELNKGDKIRCLVVPDGSSHVEYYTTTFTVGKNSVETHFSQTRHGNSDIPRAEKVRNPQSYRCHNANSDAQHADSVAWNPSLQLPPIDYTSKSSIEFFQDPLDIPEDVIDEGYKHKNRSNLSCVCECAVLLPFFKHTDIFILPYSKRNGIDILTKHESVLCGIKFFILTPRLSFTLKNNLITSVNTSARKYRCGKKIIITDKVIFDKASDFARDNSITLMDLENFLDLAKKAEESENGVYDGNFFFHGCSTPEERKSKYRKLVSIYHPDHEGGDEELSKLAIAQYSKLK